jgi:hypothetical protein
MTTGYIRKKDSRSQHCNKFLSYLPEKLYYRNREQEATGIFGQL